LSWVSSPGSRRAASICSTVTATCQPSSRSSIGPVDLADAPILVNAVAFADTGTEALPRQRPALDVLAATAAVPVVFPAGCTSVAAG
jgi:hypothetical protein